MSMDVALAGGEPGDVEAAVARFRELLGELKCYGGVAALDWHVRTSYPSSDRYRVMSETYLRILQTLAADSDVEVGSCREAFDRFA